jgi:hypothetical protein
VGFAMREARGTKHRKQYTLSWRLVLSRAV